MIIKTAFRRRLSKGSSHFAPHKHKRKHTPQALSPPHVHCIDIVRSVELGIWEWNTADNSLTWDEGMYRLYGQERGKWEPTYEGWSEMIHPDDQGKVLQEFSDSLQENRAYSLRFRVTLPCGRQRHIEARSRPILSSQGEILRVVGVNWDATNQAMAEAQLRLQKNFNDAILENIPIAVFIKDIKCDFKIVLWNKASEETFNIKKSEVLGRTVGEIWPKGYSDRYRADDQKAAQSGLPLDIAEEPFETVHRGRIYLHTTKVPLRMHADSEPRYLICISEDITELKRAEEKRQRDEQQIRNLSQRLTLGVRAAGFGVWEFDLQQLRLIWDEQMYRIYGHTRETFDESLACWQTCVHPEDREHVNARFDELLRGRPVDLFIFRCRRASDGAVRYLEANGCVQYDSLGRPQMLVGMNRDITARKLVERALEKNELLFRAMFSGAPLGIALISAENGRIEEVNPRYAQIAGRSIEELKSISWLSMIHPEDKSGIDLLDPLDAHAAELKLRKRLLRPDGTSVWIDISLAIIAQDKFSRSRFLCMIEDVSEQVKAEAELKKAKLSAEESSQVKSTFLANMSHEIRTPLSVIRGYAERLVQASSHGQQNLQWSTSILRASQQLERLLGDILDLSRVEAGRLALELSLVSLEDTLNEVYRMLEPLASNKGLALKIKLAEPLPQSLVTDATRFKQILINLIQNAIKFTDQGQIELTVRFIPPHARVSRPQLAFELSDTGVGIPAEQHEKIFETFSQADSSITRRFGGAGLGLPLARHLAHLLGGDVVLKESQPQRGSTFLLTIDVGLQPSLEDGASSFVPSVSPQQDFSDHAEPSQLSDIRILIVEDAPDLRSLFRLVLEEMGARVATAGNGLECLEMVRREPYDLILMDIQMPVLGGYEATRRLRQAGLTIPIIALTAHAMKGEKERCLAEGFTDHLSKPLDFKKLQQLILTLHRGRKACKLL